MATLSQIWHGRLAGSSDDRSWLITSTWGFASMAAIEE
jgi:hypothetical protein